MPTGTTTKASVKTKMHHNLRYPNRIVDMVPALKHNSLISTSKLLDTNYITVLTPKELFIYDVKGVKLRSSGQAMLTRWRCKTSGL